MSNWQHTNFLPKWARDSEDRQLLSEMPDVGYDSEPAPALATRILPMGGGSRVSAATLSDTVLLKQRIINYAAYEVVRGVDSSFSDLRKIDDECLQLARLDFAPFDEGSFIVPAELRSEPISVQRNGSRQIISAADVIERFNFVVHELPEKGIDLNVSMGLLSELNALGKLLKREVASIEFMTTIPRDPERDTRAKSMRHNVNAEYLARVDAIRKTRQRTQKSTGVRLTGTLVAVDFENRKLKIRLDSDAHTTIVGAFLPPLEASLVSTLMKKAQFIGTVTYHYQVPRHIDVVKVEPISSDI